MINLIFKDFMVQKKTLLFAILYSFFVFLIFGSPGLSEAVYIMGPVAVTYMLLLTANANDEKNRTEIIFNSLPINRSKIVLAKYLSVAVYIVMGVMLSGLFGAVLKNFGFSSPVRYITGLDIISIFLSVGIMISIYLPLYFKFGSQFIRLINIALFMVAFFAPGFLIGFFREGSNAGPLKALVETLKTMSVEALLIGLAIIAVIIIAFSIGLSLKIYQKKEF